MIIFLSDPSDLTPVLSRRAPASSVDTARRIVVALAALLAATALILPVPRAAGAGSRTQRAAAVTPRAQASHGLAAPPQVPAFVPILYRMLAQDDDGGSDEANSGKGVSPEQIEKYVAVYRAMQRNHSMTIEQAAAAQGLTVGAFRELEHRIESDDRARDDARNALAAPAQSLTPAATPQAQR